MKTVEERIYECLGILYFKRFAISLVRVLSKNKSSVSKSSNYFLHELSVDGIKDFKKNGIRRNSIAHSIALLQCILFFITASFTFAIVWSALCGVINLYCIMLQRYNNIRLNRLYKKLKKREVRNTYFEIEDSEDLPDVEDIFDYAEPSEKFVSSSLKIQYLKTVKNELLKQQIYSSCNEPTPIEEQESRFQKEMRQSH